MKVISGITNYIKEVRGEMEKVVWPTRGQTVRMSLLVLAVSIVMGIFIGGMDYLFSNILSAILQR